MQAEKELVDVFKEMGKNTVELTPAERDVFRKRSGGLVNDPKVRAMIGEDVLKLAAEGKAAAFPSAANFRTSSPIIALTLGSLTNPPERLRNTSRSAGVSSTVFFPISLNTSTSSFSACNNRPRTIVAGGERACRRI